MNDVGFFKGVLLEMEAAFVSLANALFGPVDGFRSPVLLFLLILIPAYLFYYILFYAPRRLVVRLSYDPSQVRKGPNLSWLRFLPMLVMLGAVALVILALARPISSSENEEKEGKGIDIMIVLDASGSMETPDFPPFDNRLEAAKQRAKEFVAGRKSDRIGMVLFAEDAFSYLPLTMDYDLVTKQIDAIRTSMMPKNGTAMGTALGLGVLRLRDSESRSKIMILLSDGASNRGQIDPITASNQAAKSNIKIYPIAIGTESYTVSTPFGPQTFQNDDAFDMPTLEKIAEITHGKSYRADNPDALGTIFTEIGEMEKTNIRSTITREEYDVYQRPLLWAGILLLASLVLSLTLLGNPLE